MVPSAASRKTRVPLAGTSNASFPDAFSPGCSAPARCSSLERHPIAMGSPQTTPAGRWDARGSRGSRPTGCGPGSRYQRKGLADHAAAAKSRWARIPPARGCKRSTTSSPKKRVAGSHSVGAVRDPKRAANARSFSPRSEFVSERTEVRARLQSTAFPARH